MWAMWLQRTHRVSLPVQELFGFSGVVRWGDQLQFPQGSTSQLWAGQRGSAAPHLPERRWGKSWEAQWTG